MGHVGKPLIGVLVATVLVFALWIVELKPSSSSSGGGGAATTQGLGQYQSAINKARQAVQISAADNARAAGEAPPTTSPPAQVTSTLTPTPATATSKPATTSQASSTTKPASSSKASSNAQHASASKTPATPRARLSTVQQALAAHKAVALLFYNPGAADDQAVKQELAMVPTHRGQVVKLAVPINELGSYTAVTEQVPVNLSPTLVVIGRDGQAGTIVGFSDSFEISQRVADALAAQ